MKRATGFTLIELMIAIVIVAVLLAIAMPSFRTFLLNAQIRSASESMHAGLNLARTESLKRNARVSMWLVNGISAACARTATGTSWVVSVDNPASACNAISSFTASPRLVQSRAGSDGSGSVSVTAVNAGGTAASCITFNGFGGVEPTCTGGDAPIASIRFASSDASTRTLQVSIVGGSVRTCNPAITDPNDPAIC